MLRKAFYLMLSLIVSLAEAGLTIFEAVYFGRYTKDRP